MNLAILFIVFSIGNIREILARSLVPSAINVQDFAFEDINSRMNPNVQKRLAASSITSYIDNEAELSDVQIQQFANSNDELDNDAALSNIRSKTQQYFMVKPLFTSERAKRFIQQRPHLTPCLFKICNMGRKRQHHVI